MARRVFFSFHYQNDIWRVNQVRNSWVTQDRSSAGFFDGSLWEEAKLKGEAAIKRLIDDGLQNTSVTIVLIGSQTFGRKYVEYEIIESYRRGNGLLGIYIHNLKNHAGNVDTRGNNPFANIYIEDSNNFRTYFSNIYPTYDYTYQNGYANLGNWIEEAAKKANR